MRPSRSALPPSQRFRMDTGTWGQPSCVDAPHAHALPVAPRRVRGEGAHAGRAPLPPDTRARMRRVLDAREDEVAVCGHHE
eukprot:gene18106-biopygen23401